MSLWDQVTRFLALEPWHEPKLLSTDTTPLDDRIAEIRNRRIDTYRLASVPEALSVPAVFRAILLISNTVGSLTLNAFRNEERLAASERPPLIVRPNPLQTPGDFFRDVTRAMASYGEAWLWIAKRDADDQPIALWPVPPVQVTVTPTTDARFPEIAWNGRKMPNRDMRQIVLSREPGALRGQGPLQACGAAMSVAVESQRWAAKFYGAPLPSVNLHSDVELTGDESAALKEQFYERVYHDNLLVTSGPLHLNEFGILKEAAQLLEARLGTVADVARAFGIPGPLLEFSLPGSSLTYQNREQLTRALYDQCLRPDYLEPIEQTMSDMLTRATATRFNLDDQLRADILTRYQVYESGVAKSGVLSVEEARAMEGLGPGNVENAPVPFAPPAAQIGDLPVRLSKVGAEVRCACGKLLAEVATAPYRFTCPRCKSAVAA